MKGYWKIVLTVAVTSLLLWLVWLFVAAQFTVTYPRVGRTFLAGDRLLVSRTSYGVRMPFMSIIGHHRLGNGTPKAGDWIVFNLPSDTARPISARPAVYGQCVVLPGDTVRLTRDHRYLLDRTRPDGMISIVVPGRGRRIAVTPHNATILCNTINLHEPCHSAVMYGDTLFVDGHAARFVTFTQNYYWAYSESQTDMADSRSFGFVPESHIIGRVACILYSVAPDAPFYRALRSDRFFINPSAPHL